MNAPTLHRRAIRAYDEVQRDAIYAIEREAIQRDPHPPEPCNFCASDIEPDRFAELAQVLGRYWLVWLIAFTVLCVASAGLAVALVCMAVMP